MPQFAPSSVHKGTPTFSNPKTAGFDYTATLCMGVAWTEMASASFHLNAGESKDVQFSVTMPATPGTYPVYFKVTCGGVLIGTFAVSEAVVIVAPPFSYGAMSVTGNYATSTYKYPDLMATIINNTSGQISHTITVWHRSTNLATGAVQWTPHAIRDFHNGLIHDLFPFDPITVVPPGQINPIVITLNSGGSYNYRFTGLFTCLQLQAYPDPVLGAQFPWWLTMVNQRHYFWLQDELGNKSPEVSYA